MAKKKPTVTGHDHEHKPGHPHTPVNEKTPTLFKIDGMEFDHPNDAKFENKDVPPQYEWTIEKIEPQNANKVHVTASYKRLHRHHGFGDGDLTITICNDAVSCSTPKPTTVDYQP